MKKDILFTHDPCGRETSFNLDGGLEKNLKANDFRCPGCNQSLLMDEVTQAEVKRKTRKKKKVKVDDKGE
jgi:DNA-directed RNA polymerase subunit RPC12/RpoP